MNTMKSITFAAIIAFTGISLSSYAYSDGDDHFEGKAFSDLNTALSTFHEYNAKFQNKLEGELTALDLHEIHELTYTMEDALAYITSSINEVAEDLESVHVATEHADAKTVQKFGKQYLKAANTIIR